MADENPSSLEELIQYLLRRGIDPREIFSNAIEDDEEKESDEGSDEEEEEEEEEEDEEEDEDEVSDEEDNQGQAFDVDLTSRHSYLGEVDDIQGRTLLPTDSITRIPIFNIPGVVLFPGETLPLRLFSSQEIAMIDQILDDLSPTPQRVFGIIHASHCKVGGVGTTAEIRSIRRLENGQMIVVAKGRQRFRIVSLKTTDHRMFADVRIRPEESPSSLPQGLSPLNISPSLLPPSLSSMNVALSLTPHWIWSLYDPMELMKQVQSLMGVSVPRLKRECFSSGGILWERSLKGSGEGKKEEETEGGEDEGNKKENEKNEGHHSMMDSCEFSYWVAYNIPMEDEVRQRLLECRSTTERLREELSFLKNFNPIYCARCHDPIARKTNIFSMSSDGSVGTYVNPHGWIHQMVTVRKMRNFRLVGKKSTQDSWFPGYAWTIINCQCGSHLGWRFTAESPELRPKKFWGIRRSALTMATVK